MEGVDKKRNFTNDYLSSIWRSREAQLLRTLNARNLDMIKESFDKAEEMGQEGLTAADFVRMMLKIFGHFTFDKDELCIQILELFANIDVSWPSSFALFPKDPPMCCA